MKTIRIQKNNIKVVGFSNFLVSYGKNPFGKYRIEFNPTKDISLPLWYSKKKPMFRNINIIAFALLPLMPIILVLYVVFGFLFLYILGAMNFIYDKTDCSGVRFFNWVNLAFIVMLLVLSVLK